MNLPLISVIVPVYNTAEFVEGTVELLKQQTYKNIEIVLVDDGSTDNSPAICDKLAKDDSRIKVIHQQNSGVCAARNAGIAASNGEYIGFCDSDDMPHKDLYETLYNLASENDCDLAMVSSAIYFLNGKTIDTSTGELKIYDNKEEIIKLFLLNKVHSSVYTKLLSRELCSKISFPAPHRINEDKYYTFQAILNSRKICYKNVCKYNYCRREGSAVVQKFSDKFLDVLYFADKIEQKITEDYPHLKNYSDMNKVVSYLRVSQLIFLLNGEPEYSDVLDNCLAYLKKADKKVCKNLLSKNIYTKLLFARKGKLPYKVSVKLFSKL